MHSLRCPRIATYIFDEIYPWFKDLSTHHQVEDFYGLKLFVPLNLLSPGMALCFLGLLEPEQNGVKAKISRKPTFKGVQPYEISFNIK